MADLNGVNDTLPVRVGGVSSTSGLPDFYADVLSTGQLKVAISDASGNALNSTSNALNVFLTNTAIAVTQSTSPWIISGTVTANQGTANATPWNENIAQFGGSAVVTGTGASGAGIPRVTVSNDSNILATQSGTWTVQPGNTPNTTPWLVTDSSDGPVTPGTVAGKSSLQGGQFNTTLPTLANTQQSAIQLDSSGRQIIAPLTNTSVVKVQLQDNSGNGITSTTAGAKQALDVNLAAGSISTGIADESAFTYGTTPQQVIGGVYQDTSPTLTAGQQGAIRLTQYRGQHANLRNSSGVEITSDSPGTAANQRLHTATPDTTTASTALGALNATVQIQMAGLSSVGFQLAAGTLIGTILPECSVDGGTTWAPASFYNPSNSAITSTVVFGSANTLQILSILPVGGSSHVRVRVSAYTSGTANGLLRGAQVVGAAGAVTAAAFGTVTNSYITLTVNTTTQLLAANTNRKYAYISNNSGGLIAIQFGSATGLTSTARGLVIPNGSFYELKGDNLYTGTVFAYTNASGLVIAVTEGTP